MRRIGHAQWLRNAAVVAGNALRHIKPQSNHTTANAQRTQALQHALQKLLTHTSPVVREHAQWALQQ